MLKTTNDVDGKIVNPYLVITGLLQKFKKLTKEELQTLQSKFLTTNISSKSRSLPRVFTEQGIAMLATILKSRVATKVSIAIMDAFVAMRKYISNKLLEQKYINDMV